MENEMLDYDKNSDYSTNGTRRAASRKTREELNEIEKQRTKRINGHILSLRNLLEMSNIVTKKDKFSVLKNTHDYIIKLRQALHQAEEKISKLNRSRGSGGVSGAHGAMELAMEDISPFETSFMKSTVAMALTGVDGHFIACNDNFTTLSGYSRHEVESTSVFNLTLPEEMTQMFNVVSSMLSFSQSTRHFSKTFKFRDREETCFVSMWLIRELDGEPLYFQIMIVPLSDCAGHIGGTSLDFVGSLVADRTHAADCSESAGVRGMSSLDSQNQEAAMNILAIKRDYEKKAAAATRENIDLSDFTPYSHSSEARSEHPYSRPVRAASGRQDSSTLDDLTEIIGWVPQAEEYDNERDV